LREAAGRLHRIREVKVSADVFGISCISKTDGRNIGQDIEAIGKNIDVICPMVYPSHYANAGMSTFLGNGTGQFINGILFRACLTVLKSA